ncbi:hypothetical protein SADUNF_Sadunf09G0031000 [Salix dunnii]|uniref:Uncharacterized protein n=1 Tax=Salix dunnii TaxID=1413687 RepID=A0A835MRX5_9ROSI|nr:hypothetical protein SADUNF_Sadunf09G0031000 [Salix dunnii]
MLIVSFNGFHAGSQSVPLPRHFPVKAFLLALSYLCLGENRFMFLLFLSFLGTMPLRMGAQCFQLVSEIQDTKLRFPGKYQIACYLFEVCHRGDGSPTGNEQRTAPWSCC